MTVWDFIIDFVMIAWFIGQIIQWVSMPAAPRTHWGATPAGVRTPRNGRRPVGPEWRRRWYGCPPIASHRASREVAALRDWQDSTASVLVGPVGPPG